MLLAAKEDEEQCVRRLICEVSARDSENNNHQRSVRLKAFEKRCIDDEPETETRISNHCRSSKTFSSTCLAPTVQYRNLTRPQRSGNGLRSKRTARPYSRGARSQAKKWPPRFCLKFLMTFIIVSGYSRISV